MCVGPRMVVHGAMLARPEKSLLLIPLRDGPWPKEGEGHVHSYPAVLIQAEPGPKPGPSPVPLPPRLPSTAQHMLEYQRCCQEIELSINY